MPEREPQPAVTDPSREQGITDAIAQLLKDTGVNWQTGLVSNLVETSLGLGLDGNSKLDLKISSAALQEMRKAFRLFSPFADIPKVTIFGSARTQSHDPLSQQAESVSRALAQQGWMVVTGAGPGIMEAATIGAGPDLSIGVSIRLPFEERPTHVIAHNDRLVSMKYFFTRKLMLVKESAGFVCLPGGFGTLDEAFELLTLQQTGKMVPVPIVFLDRKGGTFWRGFERFIQEHLEATGMITEGDLDRVFITDSVEAAANEITGFWRNYDSLRWHGEQLVLRLRNEPTDEEIISLNDRFSNMLLRGRIERTEPLQPEVRDADRLELPRLVLVPHQRAVSELHHIITAINQFSSAPRSLQPPTM